jgi:hypothetical protein
VRWWLLVGLCACRIGFDVAAQPSDAIVDVSGDATTTTITFGERPTSQRKGVTRDTYVDQQTAFNYGGAEDLSQAEFNGNAEHTLIRFELSSIAPGTTIVAARLSVFRLDYGDETPGTIEMRLLGESWVEGTNIATPGPGASWATRDGTTAWTTPGGTTTRALSTVTPTTDEITLPLDTAVAQSWVDTPATNQGVLLTVTGNTAHYHLYARESTQNATATRPELAIDLVQ